jgi:hypothetical protein
MLPFAILCFFAPMGRMKDKKKQRQLDRARRAEAGDTTGWLEHTVSQLKGCLCNSRFMCLGIGYAAYTFTTGGIVYWGIDFVRHTHIIDDKSQASLIMGGITAVAGLVGTFAGGKVLDCYHVENDELNEKALVTACKLLVVFVVVGGPILVVSTSTGSAAVTFVCLFLGEFVLLCATSVVNTAMLWSLPAELQTMGMALCIIMIHCFGDVPSTPIMGAVQEDFQGSSNDDDTIVRSWRIMFWVAESGLILAALFWAAAWHYAQKWLVEGTPALRASSWVDRLSDSDAENLRLPESGYHQVASTE